MKKYLKTTVKTCIVLILIMISSTYIYSNQEVKSSSEITENNKTVLEINDFKKDQILNKEFLVNGNIKNLRYDKTLPIPTNIVPVDSEAVSTTNNYDIFIDQENNNYYFFENTDIICGIQKQYYYGDFTPIEKAIKRDDALKSAETYLKIIIPEFSDYSLILCEYSELDAIYQIQYSYLISGIATDDFINVYVQANGEVGAFFVLNRGLYKNSKINSQDLTAKVENTTNQIININGNVKSQYITFINGTFNLLSYYETIDNDGNELIKQIVTALE